MNSQINTFIDFDGTLVRQNSSQVLIRHLLARPQSPGERIFAAALSSSIGWLIIKAIGALTRAFREKDMLLWIVMHVFGRTFNAANARVYQDVARELELNTNLAGEYGRPFMILSVGLQPVIEQFLKLHPELNCVGIRASTVRRRRQSYLPLLEDMTHKLSYLQAAVAPRYFTDFEHEARVFQHHLGRPSRITRLRQAKQKPLYLLECQS